MAISEEDAERYDAALEPMEKKHLPSQEEFYIMSRSFVEDDEPCPRTAHLPLMKNLQFSVIMVYHAEEG